LVIPVEEIPDADSLYYRVHVSLVKHNAGKVAPNCFRDSKGTGMSTNWSKYSTPERTRHDGRDKASQYGIVELPVAAVRRIDELSVVHAPVDGNDAHSHVFGLGTGELLTQQRAELYDACGRRWLLPPDAGP
jgi:hypothetical protein